MKLILGDCLEAMKTLPDKSVDLTVTSPPYDNLRTYNGHSVFDFEGMARELYRLTKPGGVVVWVVGDATINGSETGTSFKQALYFKEIGFNLHDTMIYEKDHCIPLTHNRYEQQFEYMFILSRGRPGTFNPILVDTIHAGKVIKRSRTIYEIGYGKREASDKNPKPTGAKKQKSNVWAYRVGGGTTVNHVAQFPEALAQDHVLSWSNPGDLVMDCFMGSGTTGKMATLNGRDFVGIEIDPGYFAIAEKRIKDARAQGTLKETA